ncbi:MAG: asparagine synthase B [Streptococcaceae bacterium]|jgi:asparagine synthase (glutamine-hydrolysing)|nr:asparagine synthase B [Streptococcaceae bacterium]
MCGFTFLSDSSMEIAQLESQESIISHRGPDDTVVKKDHLGNILFFHRLSIMDLSTNGRQPFMLNEKLLMCNGEIYNYKQLRSFLKEENYTFNGGSDCEVLLPLFESVGMETMVKMLDGEFVFVLVDEKTNEVFAARDPFGIRPLFYGETYENGKIAFSSEAKGLIDYCQNIKPFPPGHYYANGAFHLYYDVAKTQHLIEAPVDELAQGIRLRLEEAVLKRMDTDAPMGYLLSGGLDSSLVCAIAQKHSDKPIQTFAIGMEMDPIDLKYAKQAAEYIGTNHTEVTMTKKDVLGALREVIFSLETWDITTIRASIGMYLVAKYIHEHTDIKVLMTGEVSDELFGYKYTDFAPNAAAFQKESMKRVRQLYMYDVLRADRSLAAHSLEARVPFADLQFCAYVMSINPKRKMNQYGKGKYLLRYAFKDSGLLTDELLFREKAAFSDAVGHSMVDYLQEYANEVYCDDQLAMASVKYPQNTPFTKESLLYRDIFEEFYAGYAHWITDFWMPNKEWVGNDVNDPSARVLSNYGDSGK